MRRRSGGITLPGADSTRSPTRISPASGAMKPATSRRVVVLPQPEGPRSATSSPGRTVRSSPDTAATSPKRLVRPVMVTSGMGFSEGGYAPLPNLSPETGCAGLARARSGPDHSLGVIPGNKTGTELARAGRGPRAQDVAAEQGLHERHRGEGHHEHEHPEHRDGPELALLLQVEDHHRHDLGVRGEQDDRGRELADDPDEDEAPGGDDAAPGGRPAPRIRPASSSSGWLPRMVASACE